MEPGRRSPLPFLGPPPAPSAGDRLDGFCADSQLSDPSPWQPPTRVRLPMRRREGGAGRGQGATGAGSGAPLCVRPTDPPWSQREPKEPKVRYSQAKALCHHRPDVRCCPHCSHNEPFRCAVVCSQSGKSKKGPRTEKTPARDPGLWTRGSRRGTEGCGHCRPLTSSGMRPVFPLESLQDCNSEHCYFLAHFRVGSHRRMFRDSGLGSGPPACPGHPHCPTGSSLVYSHP